MSDGVALTVAGAEKRDAGRGVARIAEPARQELGVLSGDTVVIEGDSTTVAKVWPADPEAPDDVVRIDADTRANAGATVGDRVTVAASGDDQFPAADGVTLAPPDGVDADSALVARAATRQMRDRLVAAGDQVRLEAVAEEPFRVVGTDPDSPARIVEGTAVNLRKDAAAGDASGTERSDDADADESAATGGVTYEDIGGLDDELEAVRETIELPLREPELFRELGVDPPRGVLLHGPPGTGKTLIAKAVANEVDAAFHSISGPEIVSKYKGESEERLREVFEAAREDAPSIVFFDEIDSIAGERGDGEGLENRVVAQLLSLLDGLDPRGEVIVVGATNRPDALDPALRRAGRFDREIEIGVPDEGGRREILDVHTRGMPLADDVDLDRIAARTHGFVGADVDALVTEAAMAAVRRRPDDADAREDWTAAITRGDVESAMAAVEPSAMREFVAEAPEVDFEDVGGLNDAKRTLRRTVEWPLAYDRLYAATDTDPPTGVLLHGPPGTGKTLLARAIAGESGVNFVSVRGPELVDKYVGESEKAVREVFERARRAAPAVVFFDEIDAVAGRRGGESSEASERIVSQLLTELDGAAADPTLVVLAATNRKEAIDPALLRPGRLESHVEVALPDADARAEILRIHAAGTPLADGVDLDRLAAELDGYSGADLAAVVREASLRAIEDVAADHDPETANERADAVTVGREDLRAAVEDVEPTASTTRD